MAEQLLAQTAAAKSLLAALRSRPAFAATSAAEATRLTQIFGAVQLTSAELAQFATNVKDAGFSPNDEGDLLDTELKPML